MSFRLIGEEESVKGNQTYLVRVLFDADTNTQRNEYVLDEETLYHIEFEQHDIEEADKDLDISAVVAGFDEWYDTFGPDWRPEAFYLS
jgi:hypothetical protein